MANHKSAVKRAKQARKRTAANKARTTEARTAVKKVRQALEAKKKEEALSVLPRAQSLLARLAKKGIIKKNSAARRTSRLACQIASLN